MPENSIEDSLEVLRASMSWRLPVTRWTEVDLSVKKIELSFNWADGEAMRRTSQELLDIGTKSLNASTEVPVEMPPTTRLAINRTLSLLKDSE